MRVNKILSRLLAVLTIGVLVGIGSSCAVYWPFLASEYGDQSADSVALSAPTEDSLTRESPTSVVRNLDEIASIKSASEEQLAPRTLLSELDEEQVADLLTRTQDVVGDADRHDFRALLTSIFGDWAHSNLDVVVSHAQTVSPYHKRVALSAIMPERTDPSDNTTHTVTQDIDGEKGVTSANAQQRIEDAIDNPETTWNELVIDLQDDLGNLRTLSRVATAWVEKSGLGVLDKVYQSLTNAQTRQSVMYHVREEVAQTDPAGALKYAMTLESDPHNYIISNIANIWVRSDPRSALSAAAGIENETVRKALSESAVKALAFSEPREFFKEIDSLPADFQVTASKAALDEIARKSPEEAADLAAAMQSGSAKTAGASSIVSTWSRSDHKAALDWILYEPGVEEIKFELLSSIMHTLVQVDLELAMSTALAQPIDEDKYYGLEFIVILSLAESDVNQAIELFPQVREGPTQMMSFQPIVHSLLMNDEIDRAFDMVQQVPESDRDSFYMSLSTSWTAIDPQGMLNSMDRFPSKQAKSQAALMVIVGNEFFKILSNEQIEEAKKYLTEEDLQALEERDTEGLRSIFQDL